MNLKNLGKTFQDVQAVMQLNYLILCWNGRNEKNKRVSKNTVVDPSNWDSHMEVSMQQENDISFKTCQPAPRYVTPNTFPDPMVLLVSAKKEQGLWEWDWLERRTPLYSFFDSKVSYFACLKQLLH